MRKIPINVIRFLAGVEIGLCIACAAAGVLALYTANQIKKPVVITK